MHPTPAIPRSGRKLLHGGWPSLRRTRLWWGLRSHGAVSSSHREAPVGGRRGVLCIVDPAGDRRRYVTRTTQTVGQWCDIQGLSTSAALFDVSTLPPTRTSGEGTTTTGTPVSELPAARVGLRTPDMKCKRPSPLIGAMSQANTAGSDGVVCDAMQSGWHGSRSYARASSGAGGPRRCNSRHAR